MSDNFCLGGHRGGEGRLLYEMMMASDDLGLPADPGLWDSKDGELFVHWRNVFHSRDVVSGPHSESEAKRKLKAVEDSGKVLKDWFKQYRQ